MDYKLELIAVPVADADRAKAFYTEQAGFVADHDHRISDELRFIQLTPPGSACSIALGDGISPSEPGSMQGLQMVVADAAAAREELRRPRRRRERGRRPALGLVRLLPGSRRQRLGPAGAATALSRGPN